MGPKEEDVNVAIVGYGAEGEILTHAALKIPGVRIGTSLSCPAELAFYESDVAVISAN